MVSDGSSQDREPSGLAVLAEEIRAANEQLLLAGMRQLDLADRARDHAEQIDHLLASQDGGVVLLDGAGNILLANATAQQLLGLPDPADSAFASRFLQLDLRNADGSIVPTAQRPEMRVLRGEQFSDLDLRLSHPEREPVHLRCTGSAVADGDSRQVTLAILVFHDVTDKHRLDELRAEYISLISHDLSSPVSAILGYVSLFRDMAESSAPAAATVWVDRISDSAERMAAMIRDLVESTRLESGVLTLQREPANLALLVGRAVTLLPSVEDRRRFSIEVAPPALVALDLERFDRVITNLISNALKYSTPGSSIDVRFHKTDHELIMSMKSMGPGIPPESISKIFGRYFRVDAGSRIRGTGLGLYIARLIVEAHGGRIWAESVAGQSTTFSIALPSDCGPAADPA